jgi:SprT protein
MELTRIESILAQHVPPGAVDYCKKLWEEMPFALKLRKSRISKVGDFTCRSGKTPQITVNRDLHPFLFLMTYVHHEMGFKAEAHGDEWKVSFQALMAPLLSTEIYPEPLLTGLTKHMASPKASSFSDSELTNLFRSQDEREKSAVLLSQLPEGSVFHLNGRWFKKGKLRRTRVLCREVKTRRQYLVPTDMAVSNAQLALL